MPLSPDDPIDKKDSLAQAGQALSNTVNEQSLTFQPAGSGEIQAHINQAVDAHDASAISVADASGFYEPDPSTSQKNVESVLQQLGSLIPPAPPVLGDAGTPNSGEINWDDLNTNRVGAFTRPFTTGNGPVVAGTIVDTNHITDQTSIDVFAILYPADRGNVVVRVNGSVVAELALRSGDGSGPLAGFSEATRATGQPDYVASLVGTDRISLYDRLPRLNDYSTHTFTNNSSVVYGDYGENFFNHQLAVLEVPIDINPDDNNGTIEIVHYVTGQAGTTYSNDLSANVRRLEVFRDDGTQASSGQTLDTVTFTANSTSPNANKLISGVNYYNSTTLDTFTVTLQSAAAQTKLFANSYLRTSMMRIAPSGLGNGNTNVDLAQLTENYNGGTQPATASVGTFTDTTYTAGVNAFSVSARIGGRFSDSFGNGNTTTTTNPILVNTYGTPATDLVEVFRDESRRYSNNTAALPGGTNDFDSAAANYPATPVGALVFDGATALDSNANNTAGLQVGGLQSAPDQSALMYPQDNYSASFTPSSPAQPNYSGFSGDRFYYRTFATGATIQTFGRLRLSVSTNSAGGHTAALPLSTFIGTGSPGPFEIALKIPGTTGWRDIGTPVGSSSVDALDGCLDSSVVGHNPSNGFYGFSFAGPVFNGVSLALRIRYRGSAALTSRIARVELLL